MNPAKQKISILCVDDEPMICELCRSALEDYQVETAANGREALQALSKHSFDLILSDVMMPDVSGLELLERVKEREPDQAVVLMTGYSDRETILKALKAGADDFISKPINLLQLSTMVDKVLEKNRLRQELAALQKTDKFKTDFLGMISHKLKTPATAISLFIQNIADGVEHPDDPDFLQMVAMVQAESLYLEHLIQDLLNFSEATLQDDSPKLEPLDLGIIVEQVVNTMKFESARAGLDLQCKLQQPLTPSPLLLNQQQISFAIRALLDNAIKFTPPGGTITVEGYTNEQSAGISIRDTGIGIAPTDQGKIFTKFFQVDPDRVGQVRGFGLGLYYARKFVRGMNGILHIDSTPGEGTVATIEFSLSASKATTS